MAGKSKETVEVIVDDIVADPELIEEHDPELQELILGEWNLDAAIYSILVGHGITVGYLKDIDDAALSEIFSVIKWTGHKYALRKKLQSWPESSFYSTNASHEHGHTSSTSNPGPSNHCLLPSSVTRSHLEDVLERNEKGKIVRNYYEKHHQLDTEHKKYLAHTIVDYYIANDRYFTLTDMARFAHYIVERFPSELAEIYFNPRDNSIGKKHPSGLLYDRFHNRNKKSLLERKRKSNDDIDHWKEYEAKAVALSVEDIERQNCHKNWLRNNQQPAEKVTQLWKESLLLRMRTIVQDTEVDKKNVLAEWPRLTDENGYLLIDADFCSIYGELGDLSNIFNVWEGFVERFLQYVEQKGLNDDYSRELYSRLHETNIPKDSRDFICCTIFHGIVKPVRTSSRKLPTILQAQTDMCYACKTEQDFSEAVAELRDEYEANAVQFFPRIFVIGGTEHLFAFYVVTAKFQYKLPSFLRCIDLVVKLKFVLNYNFPESCELFWYFVAKLFYNVGYSRKARNSQLLQLFAYLKDG
ncbi:uncharacterized protein LOC110678719 [Aedes aegypti]|uniref:Uncharacterized protein n=1 Tax=Aedes aegypti TaxID=7159 RepID=A0A6I8TYL0_AEDAE|nr:uncharacterized protein LOC110678719 [Aedes aegypti]